MNEGSNQSHSEGMFYFRVHLVLIAIGASVFLTVCGWLAWRIWVGGPFALVLGSVVILVLMVILLVGWGTATVIALEGRPEKSEIKPIPAQPKVVSSDRWAIASPFERRGR